MSLPSITNLETPILQELNAVGGTDNVRFLYLRLIQYFPSLSDAEITEIKNGSHRRWRNAVQKAGKTLDELKFIRRERGNWHITESGKSTVAAETSGFSIIQTAEMPLDHQTIQKMIVEIGESLGFYAEKEVEYYDVIWRESQTSPRISHVFEVQSKGNIDSAFAKLKRAYDSQRSKPFLILASERDTRRAVKSLSHEFREIQSEVTILSFVEMRKIHENLHSISDYLPKFLKA
ncbi:MAG: winged helix-turn-helix domain-containing protein [Acidobacteriota bacterium]|nr:winged helix-turn-helix domain-containing protein [Acidobacteriota bacterium]